LAYFRYDRALYEQEQREFADLDEEYVQKKREYQSPEMKLKSLNTKDDLLNSGATTNNQQTQSSSFTISFADSITQQMYDIGVQIDIERRQFIRNVLDQYKQNHPNASQQDESRIITSARQQFDTTKSNQIM
jgi:hypothetical protein